VKKGDPPPTAAEILSLADEAEAEAAEAEALAAAARARARAIKLRREAELAETKKPVEEDISDADDAQDDEDEDESADSVVVEQASEPEPTESADDSEDADDEAAEDDSSETLVSDKASESGRRWPGRPKLSAVAAVLAVLISLVAVGAAVEMAVLHKHAVRERQQAAEYAAAARQGVVTLTSLDFEHAKEGVQRIVEVSTGTFKDDFLKMADDFTNVVEQSKVVSQGSVQAAAVDLDSMTDNSAVVLVASTSEVTNAAGAKQDPRKYRLIVTMTREGGQLKMSKVEFVP
jgi:Mce-associated membrane protein